MIKGRSFSTLSTHRQRDHDHKDDMTGISSMKEGAEKAKAELGQRYKMRDLGEASLVLEIKIERDREAGMISISQCTYLK